MKLVKLFSLAVVVAVAAMTFAGAGTALATLCKVNQSPCEASNQYATPTVILIHSELTRLTATFGHLECLSHGTLVHEGVKEGKLFGKFTNLEWTNCTGCNPITTETLGTFTDEATGGGNGALHPEGTVVLMKNCTLGAECTFKSISETKLSLKGGTIGSGGTAEGTAKTPVALSGFGCGSIGTWETMKPYKVTLVQGSGEADLTTTGSIFVE